MTGSIRVARRAGARPATTATSTRTIRLAMYESGSEVVTSYISDPSSLDSRTAAARPTTTPAATALIVSRSISPTTEPGVAPSAMRTPISGARAVTVCASTL